MRSDSARSADIADRRSPRDPRSRGGRRDSVRPRAAEAATAVQGRIADFELAALVGASPDGQDAPSGSRPVGRSFRASALDVDIDVIPTHGRRRLVGQLAPPRSGPVQVRHPGGSLTVEADALGRFCVEGVEPGPVSIRCEPGEGLGGPVVETDWFLA
jgi:hypothetical protein